MYNDPSSFEHFLKEDRILDVVFGLVIILSQEFVREMSSYTLRIDFNVT